MRLALAILIAASALLLAKDSSPAWVHEAAASTPKADFPAKVSSVVLFHEEHLTVAPDGKWSATERGAIKILQTGRHNISAWRAYNTKSGRIRDFRGWLILPSGKEIEYQKNSILDEALSTEYTYDEGRAKRLECDPDAPPGSVFAYEVTQEEDTVFTTYPYSFQNSEPVAVSRFVLSLPAAWEVRASIFNHDDIPPKVERNTYSWELRDLPWIEREEHSPGFESIAPWIGLTYFPSAGASPALRALKDWAAVSQWLSGFIDPPAEPTAVVRAKAAELTQGAKTELDKIRAIAAFAQQTNYVEVAMNLTKGGGYAPHTAEQVLTRNYGDCKDKAGLMRSLLKAAGIDAYTVVIFSGDREYVRPQWPSPNQFNHAIVAVKVAPNTTAPTVMDHPRLGRLLIFDPTDPVTPVGDLPGEEQGSFALVVAALDGDLVKMPQLPPASARIERSVDAQMDESGHLNAHLVTEYFGQSGSSVRYLTRHGGMDKLKQNLERAYSRRLGGVTLDKISPADHAPEDRMDLAVDLGVSQFGQFMQQKMLILKPGVLTPDTDYVFSNKERKLPVRLESRLRQDSVVIQLPAGFAVDELPEPIEIDSPYGVYHASWKVSSEKTNNHSVTFEQSLEIKETLAAPGEYTKVKDFFDKVLGGQSAPVILLKH
jgi:transglutaminase-like putative cysteine protease